ATVTARPFLTGGEHRPAADGVPPGAGRLVRQFHDIDHAGTSHPATVARTINPQATVPVGSTAPTASVGTIHRRPLPLTVSKSRPKSVTHRSAPSKQQLVGSAFASSPMTSRS